MPVVRPPVRPVWGENAPRTEVVDPGDQFVGGGFPPSAVPPVRQFMNWALNYCTNGIRYLTRRGISDFSSAETYGAKDIVRGDDGCLYESQMAGNAGHLPSLSRTQWGSISFHGRTPAELAADITPVDYSYPELNVRRYGADNTGRVPCDAAISAAIAVACPIAGSGFGARRVDIPAGSYLVHSPIDLTNTREPGTRIKDGLLFKGESAGGTRIIGRTGEGKPVIETTGAQWLSIEDLSVTTASPGQSSIGIFQGLSRVLGETQNQKFTRLVISLDDDAAANGGAGSIGIWNFGAEENTYDTIWVLANLPIFLTAHNPSPNTGFKTPTSYHPLAVTHSLGVTTFVGECFLVTINRRQPSIVTEDANSLKLANVFLANIGTGGGNETAWKVYGSLTGVDFNGLVEGHPRLLEATGIVTAATMRATFGGVHDAKTERLRLNRGGQGQLINCSFNLTDSVVPGRPMLAATPASPDEFISCCISNCSFRVNCDEQYASIPENLLWSPKTGNVVVEALRADGQPYRYSIDANRMQEVAIPATLCASGVGSVFAEILRVMLPTASDGVNSMAAILFIEGIVQIKDGAAGTLRCARVEADISLALTHGNGVIVTSRISDGGAAPLAISARVVQGGRYVHVAVAAQNSTISNEAVAFSGTACLRWMGSGPQAPRLCLAPSTTVAPS